MAFEAGPGDEKHDVEGSAEGEGIVYVKVDVLGLKVEAERPEEAEEDGRAVPVPVTPVLLSWKISGEKHLAELQFAEGDHVALNEHCPSDSIRVTSVDVISSV